LKLFLILAWLGYAHAAIIFDRHMENKMFGLKVTSKVKTKNKDCSYCVKITWITYIKFLNLEGN